MNNIYSVIDLGSNNIQILIAKDRKKPKIIVKDSFISELGKNFKNGLISPDKIEIAKKILKKCILLSKKYTDKIYVVGTSISREAKNIDILKDFIVSLGAKFKIISGEEEAYLNGMANLSEFNNNDIILFDIGGGSTEFTLIKNKKVSETLSLPLGIRRLDERFCNLMQKREETKKILCNANFMKNNATLVGIGGTVTSLFLLEKNITKYSFDKVHKQVLKKNRIRKIYDKLASLHISEYKNLPVFQMFSLELLATGTMIVMEILELFNEEKFYISDKNLMFGVLEAKEKYIF